MIAFDTNILVYAHRKDSPFHEKAYSLLKETAESKTSWESPSLQLIGEISQDYVKLLKSKLVNGRLQGPKVHDARIVSICIQNGVSLLYSSDRDFNKITGLKIQNPLIAVQ